MLNVAKPVHKFWGFIWRKICVSKVLEEFQIAWMSMQFTGFINIILLIKI